MLLFLVAGLVFFPAAGAGYWACYMVKEQALTKYNAMCKALEE